jgi:hypothetical protein
MFGRHRPCGGFAMELEPKEAAVYIERNLALVKSVTSLPYIVNSIR